VQYRIYFMTAAEGLWFCNCAVQRVHVLVRDSHS